MELMYDALRVCYYRDKQSINKFQLAKVGKGVRGGRGGGGTLPRWPYSCSAPVKAGVCYYRDKQSINMFQLAEVGGYKTKMGGPD